MELIEHRWEPKDGRVLLDYINEHLGELATILSDAGVIEEVPTPVPVLSVR